jgi:hypothetical protein
MEENKVATTTTTTSTTANITQSPPKQERPLTRASLSNSNHNSGSDNSSSGDEAGGGKAEPTGTTPKERKTTQRWSAEEDEQLAELLGNAPSFKRINWNEIAENMTDRTAKQCRERYTNSLKPNQKKGQWTEEEDSNIMKLQEMFGNQWSKIAARKFFAI